MKAWKGSRSFLTLLKQDAAVMEVIKVKDLEEIFDYQYYLGHVNEVFNRLGLTEAQWRGDQSVKKATAKRVRGTIQSN
jgi:adenylosuccinate lyase